MTSYNNTAVPKPFITNKGEYRKLDDDMLRYLNDQNDNLDALLNGGLTFADNFDSVSVSYTSNAVADTQDTVAHTLGKTPTGFIVVDIDKGGVVYRSGTSDATNLYLKCSTASTNIKLIVY